ncbi:nitrogen fixation protein NifR [Staphylococcus aureus]|uniref:Nitrogen fixation protein NifR n=1 Tax=Staphylococcus aureus TaxID=1280 RepID=A0AA40MJC4_STAAU|nr:nitrogen fixation protein [Staphylococcus aureus]OHS78903.1 nitrogen fixation protein NifR [Staphylococcus sp. HMSC74F04]ATN59360.1 nitrogen fixation protein NifR [Staphylococcus aureus]KIT64768.1 nitrogen fixation protein NifR [Staphylococcus aureus]KIT92843.1 nitrogen fixation protein NifR [Staphylococcus aureus]
MARLLREQCQSKTGAPTQKLTYSQLTTMCRLGWLRRHPRKGPIIKNSIYRILQ